MLVSCVTTARWSKPGIPQTKLQALPRVLVLFPLLYSLLEPALHWGLISSSYPPICDSFNPAVSFMTLTFWRVWMGYFVKCFDHLSKVFSWLGGSNGFRARIPQACLLSVCPITGWLLVKLTSRTWLRCLFIAKLLLFTVSLANIWGKILWEYANVQHLVKF